MNFFPFIDLANEAFDTVVEPFFLKNQDYFFVQKIGSSWKMMPNAKLSDISFDIF